MNAIAALIILSLACVVGYFTMVFGWGLEVQSWGWYVGGTFGTVFLMSVARGLATETIADFKKGESK
jgi:hypothetical protein